MTGRGLFTGNRGCIVDDHEVVVRHHRSSTLWITCLTEFRDWRVPLARPRRWTPIFFLDDAVALAAGHRPCATCRRDAYDSYRAAVTRAVAAERPLRAVEIDRLLARERLRPGRGLDRAADRRLWRADLADLPSGAVVVRTSGRPHLVLPDRLMAFSFDGWCEPVERPSGGAVDVLTPPTSVGALQTGFVPTLHPSATGRAAMNPSEVSR